jgi:hypothetical protein
VGLNLDDVTPALVHAVAELMGDALGWDESTAHQAADDYLKAGSSLV